MRYTVIYDGNCNLCSNLVQLLERLDRGERFRYLPMQDQAGLARYGVTPEDCEAGMILIDDTQPDRRWQGTAAAEEIAQLLPMGAAVIQVYRGIPGMTQLGDRVYEQVRDNRYAWFGRRSETYEPIYPVCDAECQQQYANTAIRQ
jgi:predicted DCC family thiol-disulfide oxidoreductase YuxK